ncbi:DNA double-strand break repair ATPase Rad50 [Thermococcus sp. 101 C5]|uniref:DNA double-strand break repair ATPase Rad50 n=1 Tax=Thermococcus sp. 101 C5 TaxID=2654197 RepID=UPI00128BE49E|nr:DNA double-strand break repair ATPase Rad50 [Thermococcus sp. 101 C5]MPW38202.1 DNA double-strand break repair ATPase Rad50 [Thermococcus sp. 101 C5]
MRIEKIIVRDFRSHEFTKVTFTPGINLIIGQNGSGKSSLLDAILVGLYWPTKPKDLKKEDILRVNGKSTEITVFFEKDNVRYQLHRNITRGIAFVKYQDGDEWHYATEAGQQPVRNWMEKMIPYDVFVNAIYIRQGEIDAILESDESREKVVRKVLGLDKYENAYNNLLEVRKAIDRKINAIEEYLTAMRNIDEIIEQTQKNLTEVIKRINEIFPKIPKLRENAEKIKERLYQLDDLLEQLNKVKEERNELEKTLKGVATRINALLESIDERKKKIEELRKKLEKLEEIKPQAKRYKELEKFQREYSEVKARIEKELKGYEGKLSQIEERLKELLQKEKELKELEEKIGGIEEKLESLKQSAKEYEEATRIKKTIETLKNRLSLSEEDIKVLKDEIEEAKRRRDEIRDRLEKIGEEKGKLRSLSEQRDKAIAELMKAEGKCPVCGAELTDKHRKELIASYRAEIGEYKAKMRELEEEEKKLRAELVSIEKTLNKERIVIENEGILKQIKEHEEKLAQFNINELEKKAKEYEELSREKNQLEGKLKGIVEELKKKPVFKRMKISIEGKIENAKRELQGYENKLKELGFENESELKVELEKLRPLYEEYLKLLDVKEELEKEEERLSREEKELKVLEKQKHKLEAQLSLLEERVAELEKKYNKEEHEKLRREYVEAREALTKAETELENLEKRKEELSKNLESLQKERENVKNKKKELEELKKAREKVQELREKVRVFKNLLKEDALAKVGEYASEIFEELTEEKYSGITVKAKENKVVLGVIYDGKERELSFLSGGERIALGLAFRLALSLYLAGEIPLLIMDEPTPYLDEERRRRLVDIMERYLRKIPQVIIVSHDEELKDAADRVVRVRLENGTSRVEEVEVG